MVAPSFVFNTRFILIYINTGSSQPLRRHSCDAITAFLAMAILMEKT